MRELLEAIIENIPEVKNLIVKQNEKFIFIDRDLNSLIRIHKLINGYDVSVVKGGKGIYFNVYKTEKAVINYVKRRLA